MASDFTTSSAAIPALFKVLSTNGVSIEDIENTTGIRHLTLKDPDFRIPLDQFLKLWKFAIQKTGNPALALTLREHAVPEPMHLVLHICHTAATVKEAMEQNIRYASLVCDSDKYDWTEGPKNSSYRYVNTSPKHQSPWLAEYNLSSTVRLVRSMIGGNELPAEVHFQHPQPVYVDVYQKVFKCPVLFNQPENSIVFSTSILAQKVITKDPYLQAILKKHADFLLKQNTIKEKNASQVQQIILEYLPTGKVNADFVAQQLNIHRRTLSRKLNAEGTSFQEILEKTRQQLAHSYLEQKMGIPEISLFLGFSEPSVFQHAFKRWFGTSPGDYKQQMIAKKG